MRSVLVIPTAALCLAIAGCATKNYGAMQPLTQYERENLTCREIELEQAKVHGFWQHVSKENQADGRDFLAFFGDFGMGNQMALRNAQQSANERTDQLIEAAAAKGCGPTPAQANR